MYKISFLGLVILVSFVMGCSPDTSHYASQLKSNDLIESKVIFNPKYKVLSYWSSEGRDGDYKEWIIYSKKEIKLPKGDNEPIKLDHDLEADNMNQDINDSSFSKYKIEKAEDCKYNFDWETKSGTYRGVVVKARKGYFLHLVRIGK